MTSTDSPSIPIESNDKTSNNSDTKKESDNNHEEEDKDNLCKIKENDSSSKDTTSESLSSTSLKADPKSAEEDIPSAKSSSIDSSNLIESTNKIDSGINAESEEGEVEDSERSETSKNDVDADEEHVNLNSQGDLPEDKYNKEAEEDDKDHQDSSNNAEDDSEAKVESKLEAEALSASLSSSRHLLKKILKRNREDLEDYSDDDDETDKEPDCKKSNKNGDNSVGDVLEDNNSSEKKPDEPVIEIETVIVEKSKLSEAELEASMSSSKSVLKRRINQVDQDSDDSEASETPNVKKSNIVARELYPETPSRTEESNKIINHEKKSKELSDATIIPSIIAQPQPNLLITNSSPKTDESSIKVAAVESIPRASPSKSPRSKQEDKPEEVRLIKAKDLAEERILEKKRLNKLLTIFDDQKPIK